MTTRVFVTVGTDHHPFTRLIQWVDDWARRHDELMLVVQHGSAEPSALGLNHELLCGDRLAEEYARADIVVSQVGPGTIADANRAGHRPIVVPRDPALGEVVDDHQVAFGDFMSHRGRCVAVHTQEDLEAQLDARLLAPAPEVPAAALPDITVTTVAGLVENVLASPRRRFSARRLLAIARRPAVGAAEPSPGPRNALAS